MRTTLLALLGVLALAGCNRRNATPTSTTHTNGADLDQASKTQAMPAPTAVETPDQASVRTRGPDENIRSEAGRSVDAAHAVLGPKQPAPREPAGEDRMTNVGRSTLTEADSGAP